MTPSPAHPLPDAIGWDRLRRPVWLFDPVTLRGLYANPAAVELWGAASLAELLSRDFSKLSDAVTTRLRRLSAATADGEQVTERWTFYPGGTPVTVQAVISTYPLPRGSGALLFEAAPVDVEESERRAVEALRHTSSLIALFDADGQALFSNPAALAAYGLEGAEFVGRFADPAQGAAMLARVQGGEVLSELSSMRTAAGVRAHHLDARQTLDPVTGAQCILLSERDVTAQVEAESALVAARERAEVAIAKERFLANMSHELRTPLNSVLGFSSVLANSALEPAQQDHVARISAAGESLLTIINDVIALSELDAGDVAIEAEPFETRAFIEGALGQVSRQAADKHLKLSCHVDPFAPDWLVGDHRRLRRVLTAYLSNAVKFTEAGEISVCLKARSVGADASEIEVSVVDTGLGITPADQTRLFQRFTPGDDSTAKRHGGGGLGLAIARELVELMGGVVGVESRPGEGSRFWFRLTMNLDIDPAEAATDEGMDNTPPLNVLYADDNESNRMLVQTILQAQGHRCDLVCDGEQAVEAAATGGYDLILMDIQMPVMDGLAASRRIRALPGLASAVPIVALTANTLSEQLETYEAAGMDDCIAKPVNMVELLTTVGRWASAAAHPPAQGLRASR